MGLLTKIFIYEKPDEMLQTLHRLETVDSYNPATSFIEDNFTDIGDELKAMSEGNEKNKGTKILNIVNKILNFALKERKQAGHGLNILTPNQMLSKLPISLAQLKAGNHSGKLKKMKLDNYCILCTINQNNQNKKLIKKLTKTIYSHLINAI